MTDRLRAIAARDAGLQCVRGVRSRPRARHGFLLPLVLVALLLVATIASATGLSAWRSMRAARLAWNGERAAQAADEAIARVAASWNAETFAARAVGARWQSTASTTAGGTVSLSFARLAPLVAVMEASSTSRVSGAPDTASRRVARVIALVAPPLPVHGALTTLGVLSLAAGALVDGRDATWTSDGCGATRDTLAVPGVYAGTASAGAGVQLYGAPPVLTLGAGALGPDRDSFDGAIASTIARITRRDALFAPSALPAGPSWTARTVTPGDTMLPARVTLSGMSLHDGLLVIDGDLVVQGSLRVNGLLVVTGALDASAGTLIVDGGVIVRDRGARGTAIGAGVQVRYSPCTIGRALATVARPRNAPFALWIAR